MKIKKNFGLLLCLAVPLCFFVGCGNNASKEPTPAPTPTTAPTSTPTPTPRVDNSIKFDFGYEDAYTDENWITVTVPRKASNTELTGYQYTAEQGYGFITPDGGNFCLGEREWNFTGSSSVIPENVYIDSAVFKDSEFAVDIANGTYIVQLLVATDSYSLHYYNVEGIQTDVSINPGSCHFENFNNVVIKDGQLNIKATGSGAVGGLVSAVVIIPIEDIKDLKSSLDLTRVSLEWPEVKNSLSYNVYRTDDEGNTEIFNTLDTKYVDDSLEKLKSYRYSVTAVTGIGAETLPIESQTYSIIDTTVKAPSAVKNLSLTSLTGDSTSLKWDASETATSYYIYTADREFPDAKATERYTLVGITTNTEYTIHRTTNIARYYKVFAANDGGRGDSSLIKVDSGVTTPVQIEKLDRGLVAVNTSNGNYISWRLAATEYAEKVRFDLYRDGVLIKEMSSEDNTNYLDTAGTISSTYSVKSYNSTGLCDESAAVSVQKKQYFDIPIQNPKETNEYSKVCTYEANDMSTGDVDGDGVYELFLKWYPTNAKDNSQSGVTGPVFIDCYKLDGTLLWRIDLGVNIRAGAHYTQYMVYDFDGDGCCELICKTSDGTVDGTGNAIGDANAVYRNKYSGYILSGPEFLTLFDGKTGAALDTINYKPERGLVSSWGDGNGNRVDRFLAGVAYLDGSHPNAIFCRGYYTRAVVVAYDVIDKKLVERWCCDSNDAGNEALFGQGAHSLSVADLDEDGFDEIIYGAASIDHDGSFMYSLATANGPVNGGHGDALHVSDFNLDDASPEVFMVHESSPLKGGVEMHNGEDGKYVFNIFTTADVGRGVAADIDPRYEGCEAWANGVMYSSDGTVITKGNLPPVNFLIWWDGDLSRELLDNSSSVPVIFKWDYNKNTSNPILVMGGATTNNGTKANPSLQADLFGDWREEVIVKANDSSFIRIYTTTDVCDYRLYTLMHDIQYRCAVAWQNTGYNQPPHPSFYIGTDTQLMNVPIKNWKYAGK